MKHTGQEVSGGLQRERGFMGLGFRGFGVVQRTLGMDQRCTAASVFLDQQVWHWRRVHMLWQCSDRFRNVEPCMGFMVQVVPRLFSSSMWCTSNRFTHTLGEFMRVSRGSGHSIGIRGLMDIPSKTCASGRWNTCPLCQEQDRDGSTRTLLFDPSSRFFCLSLAHCYQGHDSHNP